MLKSRSCDNTTNNSLAISVDSINYRYANNTHYSIKDISLRIKKGQCTGVIGPNGAGKSTLISLLCGLIEPQSGVINYFFGNDNLTTQKIIEKQVALIPQEYAFYPELSVKQNLEYFIALCEKNRSKRQQLLDSSIHQCQLEQVVKQKAGSLSGGFKRRLNIAIALSKSPQIIFLDEPTVGIDPISREEIINLLVLLKKQGKTLIYTSHMLNEVERLCDEVILLQQGKAIAISPTVSDNQLLSFELTRHKSSEEYAKLISALELPQQAQASAQQQASFQININDAQHLKRVFTILTKDPSLIKSLHFSLNSIEQLYFNSYKANAC